MIVEALELPDVLLVKPRIFRDDRGQFQELWREAAYAELGIGPFVQDNVSISRAGVLRGLHLQHPNDQGKLVYALRGRVFDVAVDVRAGSPTFGRWVGAELSDENAWQLYIPPGFAHGFTALADDVVFGYKCTDYHAPAAELTVRWDDPAIGIVWPCDAPILADKDARAARLEEIPIDRLPQYRPANA